MIRTCARILAALWVLSAGAAVYAGTVYVQNPAAKLLSAPVMTAGGPALARGAALTQIGEQGMFLEVRGEAGTGWVPRLFVSPYPPGKRLNLGAAIDKSDATKARARASNFSQTAAARGLTASQKVRARGRTDEYDFDGITWLERISITDADLTDFATAGELRRATDG